jgi:hypothetical protein
LNAEIAKESALIRICLPVEQLMEMGPGSSTLHVLGLGEHELEAVLLVDTFGPSCTAQLSG